MRRPHLWIAAWLFGLLGLVLLTARYQKPSRSLEKLWPVPPFELTGVSTLGAARLSQADLLGHPWVADFVYTQCGGPCPIMSGKMRALQSQLPKAVHLVSFTVDPDHDTPAVLQDYAARFHADPSRWVFARSDKETLFKLVYEGFRLSLAERHGEPAETRILHSTQFVLVDSKGFVRGIYDSNGISFLENIRQDVEKVMREPV